METVGFRGGVIGQRRAGAVCREVRERVARRGDLLLPLQHPHDVAHGRPVLRPVLHAPQRHLAHPRRLLRGVHVPGGHRACQHIVHLAGLEPVPHPPRVPLLALAAVQPELQVPPPPQHLEQQHPVAVHVALVRDRQRHPQLRRRVPGRAPRARDGQVGVLPVAQLGEPEVGHLGRHVGAEQHVLRLDVVVDYPVLALLVQVPHRLGRPDGDLVELLEPDGAALRRRRAEQVPVQRAILHVHERLHGGVEAEAVEADEVDVVGPPDGAHLRHELLLRAPPERAVQHLHGHGRAVGEPAVGRVPPVTVGDGWLTAITHAFVLHLQIPFHVVFGPCALVYRNYGDHYYYASRDH
ncbi:uncharacterized protein LOC119358249 [Triticum dicoccoides]|uniref:uncharacterized protein LOC119358249 n=1 Tax=Triticum dicoccoides TaxID=85692 RepID=UPI00188FFE77|nr:uncharacterized protein LOC119358249 [Triticum dicoccoides]